jgi:hypothetical protein
VTYESAFLSFHPLVLKLFEAIGMKIIISEKYVNYTCEQTFGSILHYMGNFKITLKENNSVEYYLRDKLYELLKIYPKYFEIENINNLDMMYHCEYEILNINAL